MSHCFYTAQGQYVCGTTANNTAPAVEGFYAPTNDTQITKFGHGMVSAIKTACKDKTAADLQCQATIKNQFNTHMNCNPKSMAKCDIISDAQFRAAGSRGAPGLKARQCPPSWNQTARTAYYDDALKAFNKNVLENTTYAPILADIDNTSAASATFAAYEKSLTGHAKANTLLPAYKQTIASMDLANMCDKPY